MKVRLLCASASVLAVAWSAAAHAQGAVSTPPNQPTSTSQGSAAPSSGASSVAAPSSGEVVVTAERRTTNLQSTAIAATVLTQKNLIQNGVTTINQLQFVSPSLTVNNFGQGNDVDIRGIGKGEHNSQTTTGVVTYRDGVATFPGYIQEEPYFDVASVEVLRGPQGTFSGQNATGGAVIVNTANPVIGGGYNGYFLGHYGNYNDTGLQGAVNIPISDTFAARLAVNGEFSNSVYNIANLEGSDTNVYWGSIRLSTLWTPTPNLKVLFKLDYDYLDNGGYFGPPILNWLTGKLTPTSDLFNPGNNYEQFAVDQMVRPVLRIDYTLPDGIDIRSVTGYQQGRTAWKGDIDGVNSTLSPFYPNYIIAEAVNEAIWSEEVNIISPANQPITWILGGYYDHNRYDFPPGKFDIGVPPGIFDEDLFGLNNTHSYAGFGQVSFNLPDGFQIQGGLRYTEWDTINRGFVYVPEYINFLDYSMNGGEHGSNLTGKLTLNWQVNPDNFVYAFVATGAKPGGLNIPLYVFTGLNLPEPFKQETDTDYEIGWKSRFFDNHLRTQIGGYYTQFSHFQVIIPIANLPTEDTEENVPNPTTLYGFEASAQAVFGGFSLQTSLGIEHSALGVMYAEDPRKPTAGTCNLSTGPATIYCINLKGHPQTYAPDLTFNVQAQYDFKLDDGDTITPAITYAYVSEQWATLFDNVSAGDYLDPRNIVGASLAWTHKDYTVTLYCTNLTNDKYVSAVVSPLLIPGLPRQFGISVLKPF